MFIIRKDQANTLLRKTNKNKENDEEIKYFFQYKRRNYCKVKKFQNSVFFKNTKI